MTTTIQSAAMTEDYQASIRKCAIETLWNAQRFTIAEMKILEAALAARPVTPAPEAQMPDNDKVICPGCVHQFRAIPVNVQALLLAAGFEPPFLGAQSASAPEALSLNVIRSWPEGFEARLEHVWCDLGGFTPNYKLYDLQRMLAEYGFRMEVYDGPALAAPSTPAEPVGYVNGDELDNMLDDRTCLIVPKASGWRRTPIYRAPSTPAAAEHAMAIINAAWLAVPEQFRNPDANDETGNPLPAAVRALAKSREAAP